MIGLAYSNKGAQEFTTIISRGLLRRLAQTKRSSSSRWSHAVPKTVWCRNRATWATSISCSRHRIRPTQSFSSRIGLLIQLVARHYVLEQRNHVERAKILQASKPTSSARLTLDQTKKGLLSKKNSSATLAHSLTVATTVSSIARTLHRSLMTRRKAKTLCSVLSSKNLRKTPNKHSAIFGSRLPWSKSSGTTKVSLQKAHSALKSRFSTPYREIMRPKKWRWSKLSASFSALTNSLLDRNGKNRTVKYLSRYSSQILPLKLGMANKRTMILPTLYSSSNKPMKLVQLATRAKCSPLWLDSVMTTLVHILAKTCSASIKDYSLHHRALCQIARLARPTATKKALQSWRRTAAATACQTWARAHRWRRGLISNRCWSRHLRAARPHSSQWLQCRN